MAMSQDKMQVQYVPITDVHPWDKNPKKHDKKAILESFKRFGPRKPIYVQKDTHMIIAGHGRLEAFKTLGYGEVPIIELDMPDAEARAYALIDNQTTIAGGWDEKLLKLDLQDIHLELPDLEMRVFAFDDKQLGIKVREDDFDVDAATEAIEEPITKPGDIIELGNHRLMCGDSTDRAVVGRLMGQEKASMVHTDPPYNVNYGSSLAPGKQSKTRKRVTGETNASIANDNLSAGDWQEFCRALYAIYQEFCDGDIYQWGASGPDGIRSRLWLVQAGCHWSATIVWAKDSIVLSPANYHRQYEPCFYGWFGKSSFTHKMNDGKDRTGLTELWRFPKPRESKLHPTMKPVELCAQAIVNSSRPGDIVLDLFGGSGSTLMAAEQLGRRCFMMELEPHYCDVIVQRWEAFTRKKAVRS